MSVLGARAEKGPWSLRSTLDSEPANSMNGRRHALKVVLLSPILLSLARTTRADASLDVEALKKGYRRRLAGKLAAGALPYIDIESSADSTRLDIDALAKDIDELDVGMMALSADITGRQFAQGARWNPLSSRLMEKYPDRFVPVGNGGVPPVWTKDPEAFLDEYEKQIRSGGYLLMGEFEFRHYPSPRQVQRGALDRDVSVPIDGPLGHRVFDLSQRSGLSFQIHYEVEDPLLAPLETMLAQYRKAKVIWCHVGQVRYIERAAKYSPAYLEGLINKYPNLYFDTAFGGPNSIYPLSGQRHARVWGDLGGLRKDWLDLFVAHPQRFLAALDLGGDRIHRVREWDLGLRAFLKRLPHETQRQVAYRSAWKLLFDEEFA